MLPSVKVIFVSIGNFLSCYLYDFCGNIRNYLEDWMLCYFHASIHIYFGSSTMPDCGNCRLSKSPSSISCEIELPSESLAMHILYHYTIDINQLSFFFLFLVFRSLSSLSPLSSSPFHEIPCTSFKTGHVTCAKSGQFVSFCTQLSTEAVHAGIRTPFVTCTTTLLVRDG